MASHTNDQLAVIANRNSDVPWTIACYRWAATPSLSSPCQLASTPPSIGLNHWYQQGLIACLLHLMGACSDCHAALSSHAALSRNHGARASAGLLY